MKKRLLLPAAFCVTLFAQAQTAFFDPTSFTGAFAVTDGNTGTTSNDWTAGWANWNPDATIYGAPTVTISSNITSNTTWTKNNVYQLTGNIAVTSGNTLTIEAGTVIRGDLNTKSCLIIAAGAKINAQGTAAEPIVFTSGEADGSRAAGDWGGLIILGNGVTNTACSSCSTNPNTNYIEGFASTFAEILFGGNNNADSSGVLSYVRIEFPGVALSSTSNSEINGLTMGGVGSKTKIDHIQVSYSGDDSFEWFGGAVNGKYLIAFAGLDDDFDTDFGWSGNVQYGLSVRDKDASDAAGDSNSFESDNYNPGTGRTPLTSGIFSNMTLIGPKRDGSVSMPTTHYYQKAFRLRRNTSISVFNSIIIGWSKGLSVEGSSTEDNFTADSAAFGNNHIIGAGTSILSGGSSASQTFYGTFFGTDGNDSTKTAANIDWVNSFPTNLTDAGDFRLKNGSAAASSAAFTNPKFTGLVHTSLHKTTAIAASVSVYPNPAKNTLTVTINAVKDEQASFSFTDILGKSINIVTAEQLSVQKGANQYDFNITEIPAGIYILNIKTETGNKAIKFVKG